ncbi:Uncharacterised protein [Vibrio cholerae]|nr:Uncharacterised protein [Vibrio cholerae]
MQLIAATLSTLNRTFVSMHTKLLQLLFELLHRF